MATVLGSILENGRILIDVVTGYDEINLTGGNPTPIAKTLEISCVIEMHPEKKRADEQQPGNNPQIWVTGNVNKVVDIAAPTVELEPKLPATNPAGVPIRISGIDGRLFLQPYIQEAAILEFDLEDIVGEQFHGWFEPQKRY